MKLKTLNIIFSVIILISNIYFVYGTFILIEDDGGPMGFGYVVLPFSLLVNLGISSSLIVVFGKKYNNKLLFVFNSCVMMLILFMLYLSI